MTRRVRLPAPAAFILGPVLGGLYVLVLPLIAIVAVVVFLSRLAARAAAAGGRALALTLGAQKWVPGRSYLAPRSQKPGKRGGKPRDAGGGVR